MQQLGSDSKGTSRVDLFKCAICRSLFYAGFSWGPKILGRGSNFSEPIEHSEDVVNLLLSSVTDLADHDLILLSAKDEYLGLKLSPFIGGSTVSLDLLGANSDINDFPRNKKKALIVCSRILEHMTDPLFFLKKIFDGYEDYSIYIESVDFEALGTKGCFDFVWHQRFVYTTEFGLSSLLRRVGLGLSWRYKFGNEPSEENGISFLYQSGSASGSTDDSLKTLKDDLCHGISLYAERWSYLAERQRLAIFGTSHKALSLYDQMRLLFDHIILVDDDEKKHGYHAEAGVYVWGSDQLMRFDPKLICLSVHPRHHRQIYSRLTASGKLGEVLIVNGAGTAVESF